LSFVQCTFNKSSVIVVITAVASEEKIMWVKTSINSNDTMSKVLHCVQKVVVKGKSKHFTKKPVKVT